MGKATSRPRFDQPQPPKCGWRDCPKLNLLSRDVPFCIAHAIIISDALAAHDREAGRREQVSRDKAAGLIPYTPSDIEMREAFNRNVAKQEATNAARFEAGLPASPGTIGVPDEKVYYVRVGEHIKIGYSRNISSRLNGYPPNSELLAVELGDKSLEKERHHQFHAYLAWGREWFTDCQEIRDHIATLPPLSETGRKRMRRGPANQVPTIKPRYWR